MKGFDESYWQNIFDIIGEHVKGELPSVSEIGEKSSDPFKILISTIISLRTKDKVTYESSCRLFASADTIEKMSEMSSDEISALIYPAGFFRKKGETIKEISHILLDKYGGRVPKTQEDLLSLPGVGLKTANLVLSLGWSIPAICVDIHVHRIANRLGWVKTARPDDTEKALCKILPKEYWIPVNGLLVLFGQKECTPLSPHCSRCPLSFYCPRNGVDKHR